MSGVAGDGPYSRRVRHRDAAELFGRELQSLEVVLEHARAFADVLRRGSGALQVAEGGGASGEASEASAELQAGVRAVVMEKPAARSRQIVQCDGVADVVAMNDVHGQSRFQRRP